TARESYARPPSRPSLFESVGFGVLLDWRRRPARGGDSPVASAGSGRDRGRRRFASRSGSARAVRRSPRPRSPRRFQAGGAAYSLAARAVLVQLDLPNRRRRGSQPGPGEAPARIDRGAARPAVLGSTTLALFP